MSISWIDKQYVHADFLHFLLGKFEIIETDKKCRRFLCHVLFTTRMHNIYNKPLIDHQTLMAIDLFGGHRSNYDSEAFLHSMKQKLLPNMKWSDYHHNNARCILETGFDEETENAIAEHDKLITIGEVKGFVNFMSTQVLTKKKLQEMRKDNFIADQNDTLELDFNDRQLTVKNYLESRDGGTYIKLFNKNCENAKETIEEIDWNIIEIDKTKRQQYNLLRQIQQNPKPVYFSTPSTARLQTRNSVLCLKREVRKAMLAGTIEADLRSSQLAILCAKLGISEGNKYFGENGINIWKELHEHTYGTDVVDEVQKGYLKTMIYTICFGGGIKRILSIHPSMKRALTHPFIKILLEKRQAELKRLDEQGWTVDCFGKRYEIDRSIKSPAGSLLASEIQAIEFDIMSATIESMKTLSQFIDCQILFFLHDGIYLTVADKRDRKRVTEILNNAVIERAAKHGVITSLEFKLLKHKQKTEETTEGENT